MTIICLPPVPGRPLAAGASACRAGFRVSPGRFYLFRFAVPGA
jgi:hypothetical protein